jgi:hypothetical protein
MGSRGPIPKRSSERRRRNKPDQPDTTITMTGDVKRVMCPKDIHPDARDWFLSLAHSGQSKLYEPSDWRQARVLAIILSKLLSTAKVSPSLFASWCSAAAELGTTEGARRRLHIEIERAVTREEAPDVPNIDEFRRRLQSR